MLVPVIGGMVNVPATGGGNAPSGPQWTFQDANNGTPAAGKFTTDNAAIGSTTTVTVSGTAMDGGTSWAAILLAQTGFILIDSVGNSVFLNITGSSNDGSGNTIISVSSILGYRTGNWSGKYQVCSATGPIAGATGTFSPVTSITVLNGLITAIS